MGDRDIFHCVCIDKNTIEWENVTSPTPWWIYEWKRSAGKREVQHVGLRLSPHSKTCSLYCSRRAPIRCICDWGWFVTLAAVVAFDWPSVTADEIVMLMPWMNHMVPGSRKASASLRQTRTSDAYDVRHALGSQHVTLDKRKWASHGRASFEQVTV